MNTNIFLSSDMAKRFFAVTFVLNVIFPYIFYAITKFYIFLILFTFYFIFKNLQDNNLKRMVQNL